VRALIAGLLKAPAELDPDPGTHGYPALTAGLIRVSLAKRCPGLASGSPKFFCPLCPASPRTSRGSFFVRQTANTQKMPSVTV
jgi:hypothetical protein